MDLQNEKKRSKGLATTLLVIQLQNNKKKNPLFFNIKDLFLFQIYLNKSLWKEKIN